MARSHEQRNTPPAAGKRPPPRSASRRKRERRRQEAMRALSPRRRTRERWIWAGVGSAALVALVVVVLLVARGTPPASTTTPSASSGATGQLLASTATAATGQPVDGIQCQVGEQVAYHIHAHLAVFVNGKPRVIPEGIGIAPPRQTVQTDAGPFVESGSCFYWLHSHTDDGIIHIESPTHRTYTLGQYFDIWGQPLSTTQVGPATGPQFVYLNGTRFTGDPRTITLTPHALIQIDVGTDVGPKPFSFPAGL